MKKIPFPFQIPEEKNKEKFQPEYLYIEEDMPKTLPPQKNEEIKEERGIVIIELF
jgi:hypothetical protein